MRCVTTFIVVCALTNVVTDVLMTYACCIIILRNINYRPYTNWGSPFGRCPVLLNVSIIVSATGISKRECKRIPPYVSTIRFF